MRKTAYALLLAALTAPFGVHAKYNPPKDVPQVSYAQKIAIGEINRLDKDRDGRLSSAPKSAPIPAPKRKTCAGPEKKAFTRRPTSSLRRRTRTATVF